MQVHGDFKKERVRLAELKSSLALMEARRPLESEAVGIVLDKNIEHCKQSIKTLVMEMLINNYTGDDL
jgi:DNA-binding FadR family transcriptional regulator